LDALHRPVLCAELLDWLAVARGGLFVDATVGLGGHAEAILDAAPGARLLGIDRDPRALAHAAARLARFGARAELVEGDFRALDRLLGARRAAGIVADLGVSSLQLDTPERGFSFRADAALDMRMGTGGATAADLVNRMTEAELTRLFQEAGEEPEARRVARAIVAERAERPLATTGQLAEIVRRAKRAPHGGRARRLDPATLVFQALRIAVNDELGALSDLLDRATALLEQDGRLVVISYHSLEDRAVKRRFRDLARGAVDPVTGRTRSETRLLEVLTRRPVVPSPEEIARNPRARSARLRAARRL
jgi:16S rRNA (cytosine1402-N4)-methyltransferase